MPGLIDDYGRALERRLGFDRRLARRAREEAEAHLSEFAASGADECEAIRRFGSPDSVAAGYASALLPARLRSALIAACLLAALTLALMRLRTLWLGGLNDSAAGPAAVIVDRAGFAAGALLCLVALAMHRRADRSAALLLAAIVALAASVGASIYRAAATLASEEPGSAILLVAATGAIELALLAFASVRLSRLSRHLRILG